MLATITKDGELKIMAESDLEEYALKHWYDEATISTYDLVRKEDIYFRGSKILLSRLGEINANRTRS